MLTGNLTPLIVFHLVCGSGNLASASIKYGTNRQISFSVLVGFYFKGADTNHGNTQAKGQPFSRAHPNS